ncbi:MAG: hypothetical protein N4P94_00575 [Candidatus Lightella neohaematopini]|nr:hypothetical protein [Candidatus Lightella neohaematopini]
MKNTLFYALKILLVIYLVFSYTLYIKAKIYNNKSINIYSDIINIHHNKLIVLLGHVFLQKDSNTIYSDKIILEYITLKNNKNFLIKVTATGHVIFFNKKNKITGNKIKLYFDVHNTHINSRYNIIKIKKNKNLYDTIYNINNISIVNGELYLCSINRHNNIIIYGSKIIYNSYNKMIKIWNAKFKLNNIPIFYSPYLSFNYNNKLSYFGILLPKISYNKGIELDIPYRIFSNLNSYELIVIPNIKQSIFSIKNKFNYLYKNYCGSLEFSFIPNQEKINNNLWLLYWFNTLKKNNYQLDIMYNKSNNYDFIKSLNINNYFNNKIIKKYYLLVNKRNINGSILYEKLLVKNNNYNINSFINFYYYKNLYSKLINFSILGQFTKYSINNNILKYFYIIPKLNYLIPTRLGIINLLFDLNTIYKNKNINLNYYNKIDNLLNNKYVHIIPGININWNIMMKLFINNHYTQLIKPTIEYQYNNILKNNFNFDNFYQKNFVSFNNINKNRCSNHYLFEGFKTFIFNKNVEKLYFSLGKIHYILFNHNKYNKIINNIWFSQNITNFKNKLFINSSIEFIKNLNNIIFNNTKIKYKLTNKRFLTINYYYLNLKQLNLDKFFPFLKHQIRLNFDWIINKNWTINSQNNFDIKNNNIDNQFFNIKYKNCHFNFIIKYEYKLIYNKISNNLIKKNDNHFSFDIGISN